MREIGFRRRLLDSFHFYLFIPPSQIEVQPIRWSARISAKAKGGLSFSVVDHLRWVRKQIFDMAIAEGHIQLNPALLLFTPKQAKKPVRRVMTIAQVQLSLGALGLRKRLIAKLALLAAMRPARFSR